MIYQLKNVVGLRRIALAAAGTLICAVCILFIGGPAAANDTTAAIGAGGLEFTKTDELKMEREELYLSTEQVRVKYIFRNLTAHDITVTVAFPMPNLNMDQIYLHSYNFHPSGREGDIFDFHTKVNGRDITSKLDAHAFDKSGHDVTQILHHFDIPITNVQENRSLFEIFKDLTDTDQRKLISLGLFDDYPHWMVATFYRWQQIFPAHAAITVEHWYKPSTGAGLFSVDGPIHFYGYSEPDPWCTDTSFRTAMRRIADGHDYLYGNWIEYILKTGANWAGPIGHFRLELDKGNATLLSTCPIPGLSLEKQGNSFVAEADNFTPTTDLKILFLYRDRSPY